MPYRAWAGDRYQLQQAGANLWRRISGRDMGSLFATTRGKALLMAAVGAVFCGFTEHSQAQGQNGAPYQHIIVIIEENHSFQNIIGNPAAPNLNNLAKQYGLATNFFAETHPSEPNYVALLGGSWLILLVGSSRVF